MKHGWDNKPNNWKKFDFHFKKNENCIDFSGNIDFEYIVCLAGGIDEKTKDIYPWIKERLDIAISIYNVKKIKIICVGGGTYHKKPILNDKNFVIHESQACARYLIENGVKNEDIIKEWSSYDTIANGFFTFTTILMPLEIKKILVITSSFHIERSQIIFDYINKLFNNPCIIDYVSSMDNTMNKSIYNERCKREKDSIKNIKENIISKNKNEFILWFYTQHKAYNSINHDKEEIPKELYKTY